MNNIQNIQQFKNELQSYQEGIDYTIESNEKSQTCKVHNMELAKILTEKWLKEGFFSKGKSLSDKDFWFSEGMMTFAERCFSESNSEIDIPDLPTELNQSEEIFYGWREEIPLGKTKGEVKQVFYHQKVGEAKNLKAEKNSPPSDKKEEKFSQQSSLQKKANKGNHQNAYYGVSIVSLVLLLASMAIWAKRKKRMK